MPKDKSGRRAGFRTETPGGLPDRMVLEITESYFARDPNYNQGKTLCLIWKGRVEEAISNEEPIEVDLDENPILWPCGDGWDSFDEGATAEHEKGRKVFTERSAVGILVDRCVEVLDIEDELAANSKTESVTEAAMWVGFKFLLERETFDFGINRQTKQQMTAQRLMPVKVLSSPGKGSRKSAAPAKAKAAPAKARKAEAETETETEAGASSGGLGSLDAGVRTKLKIAATKAESEGAFADAAIDILKSEGLLDDDELVNGVADGSIYAELTG